MPPKSISTPIFYNIEKVTSDQWPLLSLIIKELAVTRSLLISLKSTLIKLQCLLNHYYIITQTCLTEWRWRMENLDKSVKYHAEIIVDFEHPTVRDS